MTSQGTTEQSCLPAYINSLCVLRLARFIHYELFERYITRLQCVRQLIAPYIATQEEQRSREVTVLRDPLAQLNRI